MQEKWNRIQSYLDFTVKWVGLQRKKPRCHNICHILIKCKGKTVQRIQKQFTLFAKGSPFGKDFPRSGENGKAQKGNSWMPSAPERASPAEEKEKHSDTRTLTNRVRIAVFVCSWETSLPSQSRVARQLSQRESQGVESPLAISVGRFAKTFRSAKASPTRGGGKESELTERLYKSSALI